MAYCKWSDSEPRSDLIAFEKANGGYTAMVRSKRRKHPIPAVDLSSTSARFESLRKRKEAEADPRNPIVPVEPPLAGLTLHFETLEELYQQILSMRDAGYFVPEEALEHVNEDIELRTIALEMK